MSETIHQAIPTGSWINLSGIIGDNAIVSNSGNSVLVYVRVVAQPDDNSTGGFRVKEDQSFEYNISDAEKIPDENIWVTSLHGAGLISAIPNLAIAVFGAAQNVHTADVHRAVINDYAHRHTAIDALLTVQANAGDTSITVDSITGFTIGNLLHFGTLTQAGEPVHPSITIAPSGNTITLDRPIDGTYPIGSLITVSIADMSSLAGTLVAPISYKYFPKENRIEHIKQISLSMTHTAIGADDLFGSEPALTNGIVLRVKVSGQIGTFTNWKTNGDIKLDFGSDKINYAVKSGSSNFGTSGIGSLDDIEVTVALNHANGDFIEFLIQDGTSITNLADLRFKLQGHVEGQ